MILIFAKAQLWLALNEPPAGTQLRTHLKTPALKNMETWSALSRSSATPVQPSE